MIIIKLWVSIKYKRTEYEKNVPHQIPIDFPMGLQEIMKAWNSVEERERLIRLGETYAYNYIEHWSLNHSDVSSSSILSNVSSDDSSET